MDYALIREAQDQTRGNDETEKSVLVGPVTRHPAGSDCTKPSLAVALVYHGLATSGGISESRQRARVGAIRAGKELQVVRKTSQ